MVRSSRRRAILRNVATARNEILAAMRALRSRHGRDVFKLEEIVQEVFARGARTQSRPSAHTSCRECAPTPRTTTPSSTAIWNGCSRVTTG